MDDDPSRVRPASNAILLYCYQMLEDIVLVATWTLEVVIMKGMSVYHVPSLTPEEERQAAELLKRAISTSPDKGVVQLATGGAKFSPSVMKSDNVCWLATASISSSTEIGPAQPPLVLSTVKHMENPLRQRKLVIDVAKKLNKSDCEELVFLYQLPEKYSGVTALQVLEGLLERGIVTLTQPETLKEVVQQTWAKQDKKRRQPEGEAIGKAKLLSPKDAALKARFDQALLQAEGLVKQIEQLREILSADDDEVYHRAERILCEIQETTDNLKTKLKKARSEAKLGDTAFSELQSLKIAGVIQDVSRMACHSDPPRRKSYKPNGGVQREADAIRSSGSTGSKPPILPKPPRVARTPSQDRPDTHTPICRDSARGTEQPLPTNEELSATSDYSTGSGSFGSTSSFLKVQLTKTVKEGAPEYEPIDRTAVTQNTGVYAALAPRGGHQDTEESTNSEGTRTSNDEADQAYEILTRD
eukprot:Em0010g307a